MSILGLTATFGQSANGERFFIFRGVAGLDQDQRPARPAVPLLGNERRVPAIGVVE